MWGLSLGGSRWWFGRSGARRQGVIREMQGKGVTSEQILGVLNSHGIKIGAQRFRKYLATGQLPDSKLRAARGRNR